MRKTLCGAAAACMFVLGLVCARLLKQRKPADAVARPDVEA